MANNSIQTIGFARLSNALHSSFHSAIVSVVKFKTAAALGLSADLYAAYKEALEAENAVVARTMSSILTTKLRELDAKRDTYMRFVYYSLKAQTYATMSVAVPADLRNKIKAQILDVYKLDTVNGGMTVEGGKIAGFITDVKNLMGDKLSPLGIEIYVDALETANNDYFTAYAQRAQEKTSRLQTDELRAATDAKYNQIAAFISSSAQGNVSGEGAEAKIEANADAVNMINEIIRDYRTKITTGSDSPLPPEDNSGDITPFVGDAPDTED